MQAGETSGGIDELYQDILLDHYKGPRNHALLQDPDMESEGFNPFCGDRVVLTAQMDDSGRIANVGFKGQGCAISQASASMMTELLKGRTVDEAISMVGHFKAMMQGKELSNDQINDLKDLAILEGVRRFPIRIKCALLAWSTLQDAIAGYRSQSS